MVENVSCTGQHSLNFSFAKVEVLDLSVAILAIELSLKGLLAHFACGV